MNTCDWGHDVQEEVRRLPLPGGGGVILCREHYRHEVHARETSAVPYLDSPRWEDLPIYGEEECNEHQRT